jgi:sodium transport system permease protein
MRWTFVRHIAAKEILSTLRDSRAIVSNLVIPLVLLPVIMLGLPLLLGGLFQRETTTVTELALQGGAQLPAELVALIEAQAVVLIDVADAEAAVRADDHPAGIVVPPGFADAVAAGAAAEVVIVAKEGNLRSELNAGKLRGAIDGFRRAVVAERLVAAGVDPAVLEPVAVVRSRDASTAAERSSGQLSWLIPFFIAIWTLTRRPDDGDRRHRRREGARHARGAPRRAGPARRGGVRQVPGGAAVRADRPPSWRSSVSCLGGTVLRRLFCPLLGDDAMGVVNVMGGQLTVTPLTVVLLIVSSVLMAAMVAALLMSVTLFARSFKEAQTYVAPMSFLLIIPAIALQFKDLIGTGSVRLLDAGLQRHDPDGRRREGRGPADADAHHLGHHARC